ncbi:hypothetical protein SOPP22_04425 [Shewanella sp. OPT22]|nr:hypothetical protein SOPP22_04425 [Shewanella sp. OPT22]
MSSGLVTFKHRGCISTYTTELDKTRLTEQKSETKSKRFRELISDVFKMLKGFWQGFNADRLENEVSNLHSSKTLKQCEKSFSELKDCLSNVGNACLTREFTPLENSWCVNYKLNVDGQEMNLKSCDGELTEALEQEFVIQKINAHLTNNSTNRKSTTQLFTRLDSVLSGRRNAKEASEALQPLNNELGAEIKITCQQVNERNPSLVRISAQITLEGGRKVEAKLLETQLINNELINEYCDYRDYHEQQNAMSSRRRKKSEYRHREAKSLGIIR